MTNMTVSERTVADLKARLAERDRLLKQIAKFGYMRVCACAGCIEIRAALAGKGVSRG